MALARPRRGRAALNVPPRSVVIYDARTATSSTASNVLHRMYLALRYPADGGAAFLVPSSKSGSLRSRPLFESVPTPRSSSSPVSRRPRSPARHGATPATRPPVPLSDAYRRALECSLPGACRVGSPYGIRAEGRALPSSASGAIPSLRCRLPRFCPSARHRVAHRMTRGTRPARLDRDRRDTSPPTTYADSVNQRLHPRGLGLRVISSRTPRGVGRAARVWSRRSRRRARRRILSGLRAAAAEDDAVRVEGCP